MGWDERLFGAFFRALRAARAPRRSPELVARTASLAAQRPRLAVVAAAAAGRAVEIVGAEGVGGARGAMIALPETIEFAPTLAQNEAAFLYRVLFDATSARLGFGAPEGAAPSTRCLATLLAVPATLAAIAADLPGIARLHGALAEAALAGRPRFADLPSSAAPLEALLQRNLGRSWRDLAQEAPAPALAAARALESVSCRDPEELTRALQRFDVSSDTAPPPLVIWGELAPPSAAAAPGAGADLAPGASGTERRGKPRDHLRRVELGGEQIDENPLVHSFEKVHTADEYQGGKKRVDGADEMESHAEALDELEIREVVRSRERARSLLRVDAMLGGAGDIDGEPGEGGLPYDEWEEKTRSYRPGWCRVFVSTARSARDRAAVAATVREVRARHRAQIRSLREKLERLHAARAARLRQPDGNDVDIDAVVDRHAALAAGCSGSDKLYVSRRPAAPSLAILMLVDGSLSTDAWIAGHRVLDVARESLIVLGEVLSPLGTEAAVATFHSNTRRDCRFVVAKSFEEPWDHLAPRLATLEPTGYTRIGPAVRHATRMLERTSARRRLLLLISDGKPTDYDRYEGRYGIADVRQAVREAHARDVHTFALAIDKEATPYLAQMLGKGGYEILPRPDRLADALTRLVAELGG